jgi:hypothetical protein
MQAEGFIEAASGYGHQYPMGYKLHFDACDAFWPFESLFAGCTSVGSVHSDCPKSPPHSSQTLSMLTIKIVLQL